ncbi:thioredoxin TrxC [Amphritea sp. 2_MG-2023]|uniref:thioredoxin TrxC n=1 Tax=Amphritea TaxID=515417 RepID=UPI001C074CC0|nr:MULTISPECIES: thioredoxin TrxC [Amphritea]MBU2967675.1 thioredoxin TrxC [Amphritea atlantica]MDO6417008.1 thioredoxin TrxC [Amphritea sp. 2_MG-2023]MDX2422102.1 thioredoxin TrxC [Amphritea sp.]
MTTSICCPNCSATNNVPTARLSDGPKCGKCKQPLFQGSTTALTAANYQSMINRNDIPVLVDCWASWCGPCQQFGPIFEQAAGQFEPKIRLVKLDTEAEQTIGAQLQIRSIPTLILFRQGKEVARVSGALPLGQLKQWLIQNGVDL